MLSLKLAKVLKEAGGAVRLGRLVTSIETDATAKSPIVQAAHEQKNIPRRIPVSWTAQATVKGHCDSTSPCSLKKSAWML